MKIRYYDPFEKNRLRSDGFKTPMTVESIYENAYKNLSELYGSVGDRAVRGLETQKESVNEAYERSARTAYNNYLINNQNLNTRLINAGLSENGMTESSQIASNAAYGAELRENERSRKEVFDNIDSQIANVRYNTEKAIADARNKINESKTNYFINKETAQQNHEWKTEDAATAHQYDLDEMNRNYAYEDKMLEENQDYEMAMSFIEKGVMPSEEMLTKAGISAEDAQSYIDSVAKEEEQKKASTRYYSGSTNKNTYTVSAVKLSEKAQRLYDALERPTTNFETIKDTLLSSTWTSLWETDENGDSDANDILINLVANGVLTQAQANGIAFARKKQDEIDISGMNSHTNSGRYNFLGNVNNILTGGEGSIAVIDEPYDLEAVFNAYNSLAEDISSSLNSPEYGADFGVKFQKRIELLMPEVEKALNWIKANKELLTNYEELYNSFKGIKENLENFDGNLSAVREQMAEYDVAEDYYWSISSSEEIKKQINEVEHQEAVFNRDERYVRIMNALENYDVNYPEFEADAMWLKEVLGVDVTYLTGAVLSIGSGITNREIAGRYMQEVSKFTDAENMIKNAVNEKFDEQIDKLNGFLDAAKHNEEQAVLANEYNNITIVTAMFDSAEADWGDGTLRGGDIYIENMHATDRAIEAMVNGYVQRGSSDYESSIEQLGREIETASNYRYLFDEAMKNIERMIYGDAVTNGYSDSDIMYIQNTFGIDLTGVSDEEISNIINELYGELNGKLHTVIDRVSWLESQKTFLEESKKYVEINEETLSYQSNENFEQLSQYNQEYAANENVYDNLPYLIINRALPGRYNTFKGSDEEYLAALDQSLHEMLIGDNYTESGAEKYRQLQSVISRYEKYLNMTEDEVSAFNYICATEGRKKAGDYLDRVEFTVNKRITEQELAEAAEYAEDHPVLASVGSVFKSVEASVMSVVSNINDAWTVATGGEIDPYSLLKLPQKEINITRQVVSSNLGTVGAFLYNAGMSIADSGMRMAFTLGTGTALGLTGGALSAFTSVTSSVLSGSTVMQNAIDEALAKGYSDKGALAYGFAIGAVECLSEKAGIDRILEADGTFLARTLNNIVSEGSEEVASNWGGRVINIIADGKNSEFALKLKEYRDAGASNKEALLKAVGDIAAEDAATFLAGGLSGFVMGEIHHGSEVLPAYINKKAANILVSQYIKGNMKEISFDAKTEADIRTYLKNVGETDAENIVSSIKNIHTGKATKADIELVTQNEHARSAMNTYLDAQLEGDGNLRKNIVEYATNQVNIATVVKNLQMRKENIGTENTQELSDKTKSTADNSKGNTDTRQIYLEKEAQFENNSPFEGELGEATFVFGDEFANTIKDIKLLMKYVADHIAKKTGKNYIKNFRKMFDIYGDKYQAEEAVIKNYMGQVALDSDKTINFVEFGIKNRDALVAFRDTLRNNIDRFNPRYRPQLNAALELTETVLHKMDDNLSNNVEISRENIVDLYNEIYYNKNKKIDTALYDEPVLSEEDAYDENGRLKPDVAYKAGENKYRYKTDSLGRVILAHARGLEQKLHKGRLSYVRETLEKLLSDDAGHIFADSFGGSGGITNVFSQNRLVNRIEYVKLEAEWRKAIKKGNTVNIEIELIYEGNSNRPAAMKIKYEIHESDNISYHEKTLVNYRLKE